MSVPCVRCGYCCRVRLCGYGIMGENGQCLFLRVDDPEIGSWKCSKYDEIKEIEKDSNIPMFDNYCSPSLFNTVREEVIRKITIKVHGEKS